MQSGLKRSIPTITIIGMWLITITLVIYILHLGKGLLVPLVLASFLFYLIHILSDGIARIPFGSFHLPRFVSAILAILLIVVFSNIIVTLLTRNLTELGERWPQYRELLQEKVDSGARAWENITANLMPTSNREHDRAMGMIPGMGTASAIDLNALADPGQAAGPITPIPQWARQQGPLLTNPAEIYAPGPTSGFGDLEGLMKDVQIPELAARALATLTGAVGFFGLSSIYLMFLFFEQNTLGEKVRRLAKTPKRAEETFRILKQIDGDIRKFIGVKTFTSALTAVTTYIVMRSVNLSFAEFWAMLIFFLNFIPSIGSVIATIFPTVMALVDSESIVPFLVVGGGVSAIQFTIGNIIEPRLMGSSLNLSPLIILLSLGFWGSLWGVVGAVLCIPITVICAIVCSYFPSTRPVAIILSKRGQIKDLREIPTIHRDDPDEDEEKALERENVTASTFIISGTTAAGSASRKAPAADPEPDEAASSAATPHGEPGLAKG